MSWDHIHGYWKQHKGTVQQQWGNLTDDDFDLIAGRREKLASKIQERYGLSVELADRQVSDWQLKGDDQWFAHERERAS